MTAVPVRAAAPTGLPPHVQHRVRGEGVRAAAGRVGRPARVALRGRPDQGGRRQRRRGLVGRCARHARGARSADREAGALLRRPLGDRRLGRQQVRARHPGAALRRRRRRRGEAARGDGRSAPAATAGGPRRSPVALGRCGVRRAPAHGRPQPRRRPLRPARRLPRAGHGAAAGGASRAVRGGPVRRRRRTGDRRSGAQLAARLVGGGRGRGRLAGLGRCRRRAGAAMVTPARVAADAGARGAAPHRAARPPPRGRPAHPGRAWNAPSGLVSALL